MPVVITMTSDLDTPLWAVVPAAGKGERLGGDRPKQYQLLAGVPMLERTLACLLEVPGMAGVVPALATDDQHWSGIRSANDERVHPCAGGSVRSESVVLGLRHLLKLTAADTWVLIHDAARPLTSLSDIRRLTSTVYNSGAIGGLLASPVQDTIKKADEYYCVEQTVSRSGLWQAQTPQMFRAGELLDALVKAGQAVTDEASAMELAGHDPQLVEALEPNFKITRPMDLQLAELLVSYGQARIS